jgi:hypothetical protein
VIIVLRRQDPLASKLNGPAETSDWTLDTAHTMFLARLAFKRNVRKYAELIQHSSFESLYASLKSSAKDDHLIHMNDLSKASQLRHFPQIFDTIGPN